MSAALWETATPWSAAISFFTAAIASREPKPLSITAAPCPARARAHDLLGLRDPALGRAHPAHPASLTQLVQALRRVHGTSFPHECARPRACARRSSPPRQSG